MPLMNTLGVPSLLASNSCPLQRSCIVNDLGVDGGYGREGEGERKGKGGERAERC